MAPDKWEKLAELLRVIEPGLAQKIAHLETNLPDPAKQPVSNALARAYIARLEMRLESIRGGAEGLKDEYQNRPQLMNEIQEIESWIFRTTTEETGAQIIAANKDTVGDWFCSEMGYSYSKTRQMLGPIGRPKRGAPSKRLETLKMMDARISNGWSYSELTTHMCDCGLTTHTEYCDERIRKRIKELEEFLSKYKIAYR